MFQRISWYLKKERFSWLSQLIKYGLVGAMNTLITLSVIFVMMNLLKYPLFIANGTGYVLGFINSFIMNKLWTFRSKEKILREMAGFIIAFLICYAIQFGALYLLINKLHISKEPATLAAMVLYTGLNFVGNKWIAFRKSSV